MSFAKVGVPGTPQAALVGAPTAPAVSYAKVCGTDCTLRTVIVSTSLTTPVLAAKVGGTDCAVRTFIVNASLTTPVSFAEAALFCILLTARWVLAPTAHGKNTKLLFSLSLYLPLFNL